MAKPSAAARKPAAAGKPKAKALPTKAKPPPAAKFKDASEAPAKADDRLQRLWNAVEAVREGRRDSPRTARLLAAGAPKMAQKVVEEAAEVAIEAVQGRREALVNESVDLIYNLAVLWNGAGVRLEDLWSEMDRREALLGMAEKLPKTDEV